MDVPIFYDFLYIIRSFAEIVFIYFAVQALRKYIRWS